MRATPSNSRTGSWANDIIFCAAVTVVPVIVKMVCTNEKIFLTTETIFPVYEKMVSGVAVGTALTDRPPHRSVRAELPHTAPTSGA
jgi:hypothetical protein